MENPETIIGKKIHIEVEKIFNNEVNKLFSTNPCAEIELSTEPQICILGCEEIITRKVLFEKTHKQIKILNDIFKDNKNDMLYTHLFYIYSRLMETEKIAESNFLPYK